MSKLIKNNLIDFCSVPVKVDFSVRKRNFKKTLRTFEAGFLPDLMVYESKV